MQRRHFRYAAIGCVAIISFGMGERPAAAQEAMPFGIGAQMTTSRVGELDSTDIGIGGRVSWHLSRWIGVEGELNLYPSDIPADQAAVSRSRLEGLFGITAGPRLNRWRPFARIRPGFLQVGESPEPLMCALIFPPPVSCLLSEGETLFTLDLGAGFEVPTPRQTFIRLDIGDRMLRFPGPVRDRDNQAHDDGFVRHDVRVAIGGGWRF